MTATPDERHYVLAAGGTGGHMIPAHALAQQLLSRGHRVALVTDARGAAFPGLFQDVQVHILPAGRFTRNPASWPGAIRAVLEGREMARRLFETFQPAAVVGFGGYPAFPAMLAAFKDKLPTAIHEQNAVLGRVNRLVARRVDLIATAYLRVQRLKQKYDAKAKLVGNPVRESILRIRDQPYPALGEEGPFRVLVTGGSQGASVLSDVVPQGLALLPLKLKRRLQVTQQCREEDIAQVREVYAQHGIPADLATYLPDLPERLAWAHLVIGRAGASTVAELTAAGRPAILVPFPSATDDHQTANAAEMVAAGAARAMRQTRYTMEELRDVERFPPQLEKAETKGRFMPAELARQMQKLALEPGALQNAARRAWNLGRPNAAADMADLVERLGGSEVVTLGKSPAFRPLRGAQA